MGDYHVHLHPHTWRGGDPDPHTFPQDHIDRYVEEALRRGLTEVCFTEHLYRLVESEPVLGEFWKDERPEVAAPTIRFVTAERTFRMDDYVTAVLAARDRGLPVLLGLEIDYFVLVNLDGFSRLACRKRARSARCEQGDWPSRERSVGASVRAPLGGRLA